MFYVYILRSSIDGDAYIGSTNDLKRRISEHNLGLVRATAPRKPFTLVYYEAYLNEDDVRSRESRLKLRGNARTLLLKRISKSLLS